MEEGKQEKNPVQESQSLTEPQSPAVPAVPVRHSKFTKLQATIGRQIKKPGPSGPLFIHRVRNEHNEKDLPEGKLCDGSLLMKNEHGTTLDEDVTCPDCKQEILDRIAAQKANQGPDPAQADPAALELDPARDEAKPNNDLLSDFTNYRQQSIELQQAQIDVLRDISETLESMDIRMESIWTLGIKIDRDA